jgi:uncharacterized RmlC-like cupin family protein
MSPKPHDGVCVVAPGQTYVGKQGFTYGAGASADTVGAKQICMNILPMPPGAVAKAHYHKNIETIAYVLEGSAVVHYGDHLEKSVTVSAGEQVFVAADVPHAPRNESEAQCVIAVVHASGSDQDGIVMLPELDAELAERG